MAENEMCPLDSPQGGPGEKGGGDAIDQQRDGAKGRGQMGQRPGDDALAGDLAEPGERKQDSPAVKRMGRQALTRGKRDGQQRKAGGDVADAHHGGGGNAAPQASHQHDVAGAKGSHDDA